LVDVAIVMNNRFLAANPEMVVDILYEEPIEILMAASHPLSRYQAVPWLELVRYPQVVFKDGYGMQRLIQEWFARQNATLQTVMELNTLDAFRGVVRQGQIIALLPASALLEAHQDPTLTVRSIDRERTSASITTNDRLQLTRQVVMVTTSDRLAIPPIAHFCQLVKNLARSTQTGDNHFLVSPQAIGV
jgi:DNA-binding transcriptional LysR family regulator